MKAQVIVVLCIVIRIRVPLDVNSIFGDDRSNLICSAKQMTKSWYTTVALDYKTIGVGIEKKKITT